MHRSKQSLITVALTLLILVPIQASDENKTKTIQEDVVVTAPAAVTFSGFSNATFNHEMDIKVVTGAPYSAQATTETVQLLADGNRIVRRNATQIARDSQGRTRHEYTFTPPGGASADPTEQTTMISINDPTTGITHTLHTDTRTAEKVRLPEMSHVIIEEETGASASATSTGVGVSGAGSHIVIHKTTGPGGVVTATSGVPGPHIARYKFRMAAGGAHEEGTTEQLGREVMEGLEVEGKRTTMTIPAGEIGNEQPILITNESWYSPELQVIVYSKRDDPMSGTTTYKLTNIVRAEPDPSLFEVPADYKIERSGTGIRRFEHKSPAPRKE